MKRFLIIMIVFGWATTSCFYDESIPSDQNVWPVLQPRELEMDEARLLEMDSVIVTQPGQGIESLVVVKSGNLIYEKYYYGNDRSTQFELGGVSSFVSNLALGRAIDMGLISSVSDSIYKYLPAFEEEFEDFPLKKNITFAHLMTMKSGLSWNELSGVFDGQLSDIDRMIESENWAEYLITKPLDALPGSRYAYNSAIPIIITEVIESQYGDGIHSFLLNEVFNSISVGSFDVARVGDNANMAWGVSLSTLDLAKLGYLYLEEGDWFGNQIVNPEYMKSSVDVQTNIDYFNDFGWMWWRYADNNGFLPFLEVNDTFFAGGIGEQRLYVVPHLELVVAITGKNERADFDLPSPLIFRDYILRSIQ
ncbi:MAG: serine hydrolase [Reichenbachiella sp.]|uniref:serine hydrolase domain-containing protein n=1 Tax=Reichenbachiella sp. TaxID=2184521 RepID=UPI0029664ACB|nr:serine hydrolase [Reichenbachiella sp.]MDW3211125.1 serine hydrolase [Reichenbachiella sp.]